MARKPSRVPIAVSPQIADDFKLIKGIGPAIADRLYDAGIHTYTQLASLSPAELTARVNGLSAKQIARQDWIGQARKQASKKAGLKPRKTETTTLAVRQHYVNFTVEFLLDEKNLARRTHVVHIQSGDVDTWAGLEAEQLINFFVRHIGRPSLKSPPQEIVMSRRQVSQNTAGRSNSMVKQRPKSALLSPAAVNLAGTLRFRDLRVVSIKSDTPIFSLRQGQPYLLRFALDLSEVIFPGDGSLICQATIMGKQLGGQHFIMGETSANLKLADNATLSIVGTSLPRGIYRLNAFVRLTSIEAEPSLTVFLKGNLLQVH